MQVSKKDVYKRTSQDFNIDLDLITEVGDAVFKKWHAWQKMPTDLRLKIRGLGVQYLRKKKNISLLENLKKKSAQRPETYKNQQERDKFDRIDFMVENLEHLIYVRYPEFVKAKQTIRNENREI